MELQIAHLVVGSILTWETVPQHAFMLLFWTVFPFFLGVWATESAKSMHLLYAPITPRGKRSDDTAARHGTD